MRVKDKIEVINAAELDYRALNERIRQCGSARINACLGQRFIASGMREGEIEIHGTPGNALGAYLAGANITVYGNAQDAVGDTMNDGRIIVHGGIGDAAGYAMRGGEIIVRGDAGYRVGIHMKEYREKCPAIVIGGVCGSFLGEYQAGGRIVVLGLDRGQRPIVGNFPCTGMHGGKMLLRGDASDIRFPLGVSASAASEKDMSEIMPLLRMYSESFDRPLDEILAPGFTVVTPNSSNPYKQMYVAN